MEPRVVKIGTWVDAPAHDEHEYMFGIDLGARVAEKTSFHCIRHVESGANRVKLAIFVSLEG